MSDWHPIRVAARRTGLTPHVIRAWEKRYGAIRPHRTETNRRLYSQEDLERLSLLRRGTLAGRGIGQIAQLPTDELRRLVEEDEAAQQALSVPPSSRPAPRAGDAEAQPALDACLDAIERLDPVLLERALETASVSMSRPALVSDVIVPLMQAIGDRWREGTLRVAHEHMATSVVRAFVENLGGAFQVPSSGPGIIVATPSGHVHEIGAVLAASTAASEGWIVTYLGPSLPADEIAGAARQKNARAVALSLIYPQDDPNLRAELERLARLLPPETALLVGGPAAEGYRQLLEGTGAIYVPDFDALRTELESLRVSPPGGSL